MVKYHTVLTFLGSVTNRPGIRTSWTSLRFILVYLTGNPFYSSFFQHSSGHVEVKLS